MIFHLFDTIKKLFYIARIIVVAELPTNITVKKGSAVIPTKAQTDRDLPRSHSESYQGIKRRALKPMASSLAVRYVNAENQDAPECASKQQKYGIVCENFIIF